MNRFRLTLLVNFLLLLPLLPTVVYAQGESAEIQRLRREAEAGNAQSQCSLGSMYFIGEVVPQDLGKAFIWYRRAANQGHASCQFSLAHMYNSGEGAPKDETLAFSWFKKSAEQGFVLSQGQVGLMYQRGIGVPKDERQALTWFIKAAQQGDALSQDAIGAKFAEIGDFPKALKWLQRAADQGWATAQVRLAFMYADGNGVPRDNVLAYMWANLAAAKNISDLPRELRQKLEREMTPAQIDEAQRLSREWKPKK